MIPMVLTFAVLASDLAIETPRRPNPLAPSLPLLTEQEENELDRLIDRFILADTGKLRGPEAKQAMDAFKRLGPEATFALIRGMNRAAAIDHSCPAVLIARKLSGIIASTTDVHLVQFARENIGAGVERSRHMAVLKELKFGSALRTQQLLQSRAVELRGLRPR